MRAALAAEVRKLATLPAAAWSILLAVLLAGVTGAALAAGNGLGLADAVSRAASFAQVAVIIGAVIPVAQEYSGGQIRTSLRAEPRRGVLLAAKAAVTATWVAGLAVVAAAAAAGGAFLAGATTAGALSQLGLTAAYLWIVGLLGAAVALLLRGFVVAVATSLTAVLIASPLLAGATDLARWLPDRAAAALLGAGEGPLTAGGGAAVALGWVACLAAAGSVALMRRDA